MFKIESYITPILISYVEKYIKNLKASDTQVSRSFYIKWNFLTMSR